jgi:hypothetical protein
VIRHSLEWAEDPLAEADSMDATMTMLMMLLLALVATVLGTDHNDLG